MDDKDKMPPDEDPRNPRVPENRDMPARPDEVEDDRIGEGVEDALKEGLIRTPPG